MSEEPIPRARLQALRLDWLDDAGVEVGLLRLDEVDPLLSGNKRYKLHGYLRQREATGAPGLISLGGPHSNHLHALAAAGRRHGFATVGLLRGEPRTTPTVADLEAFGMRLHWLGYGGYRARHQPGFWRVWQRRYPGFACVPEGGGGLTGALGCAPLVAQVQAQLPGFGWPDHHGWWLAVGTGTTLAGLVIGEDGRRPVYGALAGPVTHGVGAQVARLLDEHGRPDEGYRLVPAARRGFGRADDELLAFMADTERAARIPLEPVYTAKALLALREEIARGRFAAGTRLIVVHTGGLQGRRALAGEAGALR
ncbi:1-aminocyclopropane-1-carboxylate deaminase/D-cysteine desulfhydrase [Stutzerimonas azotifigens]|uniref:1-aminocyclopropane-1-carboxylate deaminase/D-cysteine desulfhydrase n=1 Tax=Stutzerimonas azotifigens TaxID=291995 RepID=UPI000419D124|nr:pyridoxal-phosphate dependent enzyme [Stutzerimonas azotifigens]